MIDLDAFWDELRKIAGAEVAEAPRLLSLGRVAKPLALMGGGAVAYHLANKELDKYQLGRRVYEQMHAQGQG